MKETMTPRERWQATLDRQAPDRVPMDIWITPEAQGSLCRYLGCDFAEAQRQLRIDAPFTVWGNYIGPQPPAGVDIWGVRHVRVEHGTGAYDEAANAPLAPYE